MCIFVRSTWRRRHELCSDVCYIVRASFDRFALGCWLTQGYDNSMIYIYILVLWMTCRHMLWWMMIWYAIAMIYFNILHYTVICCNTDCIVFCCIYMLPAYIYTYYMSVFSVHWSLWFCTVYLFRCSLLTWLCLCATWDLLKLIIGGYWVTFGCFIVCNSHTKGRQYDVCKGVWETRRPQHMSP